MITFIVRQNISKDNREDKWILIDKDIFSKQMQNIIFIKEKLMFIMMMGQSKIYYLKMVNLLI